MSLMIEMKDIAVQGVSHSWTPASGTCDAYGILRFGTPARGVTVYFHQPAEIDEAIAELVALRAEMDPPVITGSAPAAHHGAHGDQDGGDFDGFYERVRTASADAARDMLYFIRGYCQEAACAALDHAVKTGLLPAPVITDSERTCDQAHPEPGGIRSSFPCCEHCTPACDGQGHGRPCTTPRCPAAQPAATGQGGVLFPAGDGGPRCECSHEQAAHDEDGAHECTVGGCGCMRWRTAAPKAQPEPPRIVAGAVVPRLRRLAVAE